METRHPGQAVQRARFARHGRTLSIRSVQVESNRAPPVQRDQQELGGPAARQLRNHLKLYTDHQDRDRAQSKRPSRQEAVCQGHQNLRHSDGRTQHQATHFAAEVELRVASIQEWEIIFATVLSRVYTSL